MAGSENSIKLIQAYCGGAKDIAKCIEKTTFSERETFKDIQFGYSTQLSLLSPALATTDFTASFFGQMYTINIGRKITPDDARTQIFISFDYFHDYVIFIHDQNYFLVNDNPYGLPSNMMKLYPNRTANLYHRLALVERLELNVPDDQCVEDPVYNFQTCVRETLASRVGCRTKWDRLTTQNRPICKTIDQYRY